MPQIELNSDELKYLIQLCGLKLSEYSAVQIDGPDASPDIDSMLERGMIVKESNQIRANHQLRSALHVVVEPQEVIDFSANGQEFQEGFTICRREDFLVQCNQHNNGNVMLAFPLDRNRVVETVAYCFSGDRDSPSPLNIHFECSAESSFVLGAFIREFSSLDFSFADAQLAVNKALNTPELVLPFILGAGADQARLLQDNSKALFEIVNELIQRELVRLDGQDLAVDKEVAKLLSGEMGAAVQLCRFNVSQQSYEKLHAFRVGERILMMIPRVAKNGRFLQHWEEVDREVLRKTAVSLIIDVMDFNTKQSECSSTL